MLTEGKPTNASSSASERSAVARTAIAWLGSRPMRFPWPRRKPQEDLAGDWIAAAAWRRWEAPRNYVAGEASYAAGLRALTGPVCRGGYCRAVVVEFVREPGNQYDPNALRAVVESHHIGYLRRHLAARIAPALDGSRLSAFEVPGILRGGSSSAPNVGCHVWLGRCVSPSGMQIDLPRSDPEWEVPWPPGRS